MHTEEEAKLKWCPEVRAGDEPGCNRSVVSKEGYLDKCIASGCMAWRWAIKKGDYFYSKGGHVLEIETVGRGYCGKAGKP